MPHMGPEELCNSAWALVSLHNTLPVLGNFLVLGDEETAARCNSSSSHSHGGGHLLTNEAYALFCACLARLPTGALSADQLEMVRMPRELLSVEIQF